MAFTRDRVHEPELQAAADVPPEFQAKLEATLKRLPIPVVSLPPLSAHSPWWLAYLAHEVGHHIQHDLLLVGPFQEWLQEQIGARWAQWTEEVFADIFSVYMIGPPAVWAVVELEIAEQSALLADDRPRYPPAWARLRLLAGLSDALTGDQQATTMLSDFDPSLAGPVPNEMAADAQAVQAIVAKVQTAKFERFGTFEQVCAWQQARFKPKKWVGGKETGGDVLRWARALRGATPPAPETELESARLAASGAMLAWAQIACPDLAGRTKVQPVSDDDTARAPELDRLRTNVGQTLPECRQAGERPALRLAQPDLDSVSADLAGLFETYL